MLLQIDVAFGQPLPLSRRGQTRLQLHLSYLQRRSIIVLSHLSLVLYFLIRLHHRRALLLDPLLQRSLRLHARLLRLPVLGKIFVRRGLFLLKLVQWRFLLIASIFMITFHDQQWTLHPRLILIRSGLEPLMIA